MKLKKDHVFIKDKKLFFSALFILVLALAFWAARLAFKDRQQANPIHPAQNQQANNQIDTTPIPLLYPGLPWEPVNLGPQTAFFIGAQAKDLTGTAFEVKAQNFKTVSAKVLDYYKKTLPAQDWHEQLTVNGKNISPITNHTPNGDEVELGYVKYAGGKLYGFTLTVDQLNSKFIVYYSDAFKVSSNFPN